MVKFLTEFWVENSTVLCGVVFFLFALLLVVLMYRGTDVKLHVDAEIVKIDDGVGECVFTQGGKDLKGFVDPCPKNLDIGDVWECEVLMQDLDSGLWKLRPLEVIMKGGFLE